ncbi:hypothetical protein CA850_10615 [Micromonospora echinospora]|uniref:Uncharacterized protein n=1 Tax=Micromonospora echinospora TaxID=1877 RepID=A0A1C4ZNG6_MICEC|nr:hypothetical protein CA850_10615 [Micromonospora echinospora]SCF34475.1 hypothetical protein GA0070618_5518 [Micromonospora echinospora]
MQLIADLDGAEPDGDELRQPRLRGVQVGRPGQGGVQQGTRKRSSRLPRAVAWVTRRNKVTVR